MQAPRLRHKVTIQQPIAAVNGYGERIVTWSTVATVWAAVRLCRGREFFDAEQVQANVAPGDHAVPDRDEVDDAAALTQHGCCTMGRSSMLTSGTVSCNSCVERCRMRHDDQVFAELQAQYNSLTAHIAAVDRDLATELDAERRLVLTEKRSTLDGERRSVVSGCKFSRTDRDIVIDAKNLPAASTVRGGRTVDYDELMRMIYEIRRCRAIVKRRWRTT